MLIFEGLRPIPVDCYLLRYGEGTHIPPHRDPVTSGRHFRLNVVLREARRGGRFVCEGAIFSSRRINLFRPDMVEHAVTRIDEGTRIVLSVGWLL